MTNSGTHEIYWALRESIVFGVLVSVLAFHGWDSCISKKVDCGLDGNPANHLIYHVGLSKGFGRWSSLEYDVISMIFNVNSIPKVSSAFTWLFLSSI